MISSYKLSLNRLLFNGGGKKKLLTTVASSLRSHKHHRRRIHHHCYCYTGLATRWTQNVPAFARTASNSASSNPPPQVASDAELSAIVHRFPSQIGYAFGYGSGVFRQQSSSEPLSKDGIDAKPGMVDIIIATENPRVWHERNMLCHSDHYSLMARIGGPEFVTWLQVNFGAKLYFHPFVSMDINLDGSNRGVDSQPCDTKQSGIAKENSTEHSIRRQIKYGVVSTDDLIRDLIHWDYLYLAGRMHKPIVPIDLRPELSRSERPGEEAADRADEVEDAQRTNLLSAVAASLLLYDAAENERPQSMPVGRLYETIAGLSYAGDFRMRAGAEDPNKAKNLVETPGMGELWEGAYAETLGGLRDSGLIGVDADADGGKRVEFEFANVAARKELARHLPPRLRGHSDRIAGTNDNRNSILRGHMVLRRELENIVAPAAKMQGVKGFVSAGVTKSWRYAMAKFAKGSGKVIRRNVMAKFAKGGGKVIS